MLGYQSNYTYSGLVARLISIFVNVVKQNHFLFSIVNIKHLNALEGTKNLSSSLLEMKPGLLDQYTIILGQGAEIGLSL